MTAWELFRVFEPERKYPPPLPLRGKICVQTLQKFLKVRKSSSDERKFKYTKSNKSQALKYKFIKNKFTLFTNKINSAIHTHVLFKENNISFSRSYQQVHSASRRWRSLNLGNCIFIQKSKRDMRSSSMFTPCNSIFNSK